LVTRKSNLAIIARRTGVELAAELHHAAACCKPTAWTASAEDLNINLIEKPVFALLPALPEAHQVTRLTAH